MFGDSAGDASKIFINSLTQLMIRPLFKELIKHKSEKRETARFRTRIVGYAFYQILTNPKPGTLGGSNNHLGQHVRLYRSQGIIASVEHDSPHLGMCVTMMQMIAPDRCQHAERTLLSRLI